MCISLFDQIIHGPNPPISAVDVFEEIQNSHNSIPYIPAAGCVNEFGHLAGYGAGYYSYLYSKLLSSNIWYQCFLKDPLSR